jgi:Ser/Thr protein kinase RdoA (MazF antagonist)
MTLPHSLNQLLTHQDEKFISAEPITNGLIHQTFRLNIDEECYLLQSINTNIFTDPLGLINNHRKLYQHFLSDLNPFPQPLARPLPFPNNQWIVDDEHQRSWRISTFIHNTHTRSAVENPSQAEALARFFASFTLHASLLQTDSWHIPIPRFHDLRLRYEQFKDAIRTDKSNRSNNCDALIQHLQLREPYIAIYDNMSENEHFPLRMMHHDAKLSNILIDDRSDSWLCPVDLDTVMPGYFFSDLGDMIRSICNGSLREDSPPEEVIFQADLFESLLSGYGSAMGDALTQQEKDLLPLSGILMTYMQAMRFLSDYLNGDIYYITDRANQNLDRALNQFTLLSQMEEYLKATGRLDRLS